MCLLIAVSACSSDPQQDTVCISFDMRQCGDNPWLSDAVIPQTAEVHRQGLMDFFDRQDISDYQITIDMQYHEIVCEACFVCPQGPRIYVKLSIDDAREVERMDLLNYQKVNCTEIF